MTDESRQDQCTTRRCVLLGAGALGAAGLLTACSTAAVPYDANDEGQAPEPESPTGAASAMAASGGMTGTTGTLLGTASSIPVGGGMAFTAAKVVVTQPTKDQYKGFSAVCTHVGCICNTVADGTINCPCHGSKFKITDGAVVAGPAPSPLPAVSITVANGNVYLT
jgi:Rieske Fe-S protein